MHHLMADNVQRSEGVERYAIPVAIDHALAIPERIIVLDAKVHGAARHSWLSVITNEDAAAAVLAVKIVQHLRSSVLGIHAHRGRVIQLAVTPWCPHTGHKCMHCNSFRSVMRGLVDPALRTHSSSGAQMRNQHMLDIWVPPRDARVRDA